MFALIGSRSGSQSAMMCYGERYRAIMALLLTNRKIGRGEQPQNDFQNECIFTVPGVYEQYE